MISRTKDLTPDIGDTVRNIQEDSITDHTAREKVRLELMDAKWMLEKTKEKIKGLELEGSWYDRGRESMLKYFIIRLEGLLR